MKPTHEFTTIHYNVYHQIFGHQNHNMERMASSSTIRTIVQLNFLFFFLIYVFQNIISNMFTNQ